MKKLTILFTFLLLLNSCSNDDNSGNQEEEQNIETFDLTSNATSVIPLQLVVVGTEDLTFSQNSYMASFGETDVTLTRNSDGNLVFPIPDVSNGEYELKLITQNKEGLVNFNVGSNNIQNVENKINQEFLQPLQAINQNIEEHINNGNMSNETMVALNSAKLMYDNFMLQYSNASNEDKMALAKFFNANPIFTTTFEDAIINNRLARNSKTNSDFLCFINNSVRIAVISGAFVSWVNVIGPAIIAATGGIGSILVGVATIVGVYNAAAEIQASIEQIREVCLRPISNHLYDQNGNFDNFIMNNNSFTSFDLKLGVRTSITSDSNDPNSLVSELIEKIDYIQDKWNSFRDSLNQVINDSTGWFTSWFSSSTTYEPITSTIEPLPQSTQIDEIDGNNAFVIVEGVPNDITAEVEIVGQSGYNIKFNTDNATLPRTFTMTIKYDDGDFQASDEFNVTLEEENQIDIVGTWTMVDNGINCQNNTSGWGGNTSIEFFSNGTLSWQGIISGTFNLNGNDLYFEFGNNQTNTYNCSDGSTLESDYNMISEFNGVFDGTNFNGSFSHIVTYTPNLSSCIGDSNENCQGPMALTQ
ncbi:hypothetical protein [Thalassobellus citreus]|uniref:hypothetical protein n=1 Tax=Thalassobellus citreus TaxID=3367752 RepID=UPI00378EAF7A